MTKIVQFLMLFLLVSCSNYLAEPEEETESNLDEPTEKGDPVPINFKVRGNSEGDINYPIDIFIFNKSGKLIKEHKIENAQGTFNLQLFPGQYHLSAFAGLNSESYTLPKEIIAGSSIVLPENLLCPTPLQNGQSAFKLEKKTELSINLSYVVSSLEFKFNKVPADATGIEVSIYPVSQGYSLSGDYTKGRQTCNISCHLEGNTWVAGPVYTLPSESSKTTLTISVQRPSGTETFSYNYHCQLEAAQPYRFSGNYREAINISGIFEASGWKPGIDVEFDFVEEGEENIPDDPSVPSNPEEEENLGDLPVFSETALPKEGDFWQGCYVWEATNINENEVRIKLLSPQQWFNILASEGNEILKEYKVGSLTEWRVFTSDEARSFYSRYGSNLAALNKLLGDKGQDNFFFYNDERYLCNNCESTFNLYGKQRVLKAGTKTKYYLRGVKSVIVKLKP